MRVKICGITRPDQGVAIANLGATALGFILVPSSPRYVTLEQVKQIINDISLKIDYIGVFADAAPDAIREIVIRSGLTSVQLHGNESADFCAHLRQLLPGIEIIKALRVKDLETLEKARSYFARVDTLLLDAYHPHLQGGTGHTLDWESLAQFTPPLAWFLAGGLTDDNISDALTRLSPDGIDISSGVERSPGDKDMVKIARLFEQLRQVKSKKGNRESY